MKKRMRKKKKNKEVTGSEKCHVIKQLNAQTAKYSNSIF